MYDDKFVDRSRDYACEMHKRCNHNYNNKPYSFHLNMVVDFCLKYIYLIDKDKRHYVIAGAWNHDTIEDTPETYNDVMRVLGKIVAEIVFKLSNEKGRTRAERANYKYYSDIRSCKLATFIKICDRLANLKYSKDIGSSMFEKYKKEHIHFTEMLYTPEYKVMFDFMDEITGIPIRKNLLFRIKIFFKR